MRVTRASARKKPQLLEDMHGGGQLEKKQKLEDPPSVSRASKSRSDPDASVEGSDSADAPPSLPLRLFASNSYPSGARLNIYSKAAVIGSLYSILSGTEAMSSILNSEFGKLFTLPAARCANSVKLIHGLLSRQLVTAKKHEIWSVFGGKPLKFSLREFHIISGLRCSKLPPDSEIQQKKAGGELFWNYLFPPDSGVPTVQSVLENLRNPYTEVAKILPLALLVIVDGIVICSNKNLKISEDFVYLLEDIPYFLSFPWEWKCFSNTFSRFGPAMQSTESLIARLKQMNNACYGFPLPLQLVAFECIPLLKDKIPNSNDMSSFMENPSGCKSAITLLNQEDIAEVESNNQLVVQPILETSEELDKAEFRWDDKVDDPKVEMLESMISIGHSFAPSDFLGGIPAGSRLEPRYHQKKEAGMKNDDYTARTRATKNKAKATEDPEKLDSTPPPLKKLKAQVMPPTVRLTHSQVKKAAGETSKPRSYEKPKPQSAWDESLNGEPSLGSSAVAAMIDEFKLIPSPLKIHTPLPRLQTGRPPHCLMMY